MGFRVLKFGGSSVANATAMSRVLDIVGPETEKGRVVLVSSAISGCTDGLLACAAGDTSGLQALKERHLAIVRRLFTGAERVDATAEIAQLFDEMLAAPEEKVDARKQARICAAALKYLKESGSDREVFFDVVSVTFAGDEMQVKFFPQAWIPMYK